MLKNQIASHASSSTAPSGKLPRQPESNPRIHCKAVVLRVLIPRLGCRDRGDVSKPWRISRQNQHYRFKISLCHIAERDQTNY